MKKLIIAAAALFCLNACQQTPASAPASETVLIKINQESVESPTIAIEDYTLITSNPEKDSADASAIMKLKRKLPLAMEKKDSTLFQNILARTFTYRSADAFFTRKDFISQRISGKWTIDTIQYKNMALQVFGDVAVLTYHNRIESNDATGKTGTAHYAWTDIYVKEAGEWKIGGIHEIKSDIN